MKYLVRISSLAAFTIVFFGAGAFHAFAAATANEIFTTTYGGSHIGAVPAGTTYAGSYVWPNGFDCPSGGSVAAYLGGAMPNDFYINPAKYCSGPLVGSNSSIGPVYVYSGNAPAPVSAAGVNVDNICIGGSCSTVLTSPAVSYFSTKSCSIANACGTTASGYQNINGGCDVSAPSLPSGYGQSCSSAANACGYTNTGTIGCSGSCSASAPSLPSGYGQSCSSAANSCGMTNTGTINCSGVCSASAPSNSLCAPTASCTVSPSSGYQGKTSFTYTASASGGNGSYSYLWSGNGSGADSLSGSATSISKTYTAVGSRTASVQVTSNGNSATAICSPSSVTVNSCVPVLLTPNPATVDLGQQTALGWSVPSACASSCQFSDGHNVSGTSGTYTVTPPPPTSGTTDTYSITCPAGSSYTAQTAVTVRVPAVSITATPARVQAGSSSTIGWDATNVDSCSITKNGAAWPGHSNSDLVADVNREVKGSSVDTISSQNVYVITCLNDSGTVSAQATNQVTANVIPSFQEF